VALEVLVDWKLFATVFGTVFVAELGDKTQLATLLFAADRPGARLTVFAAAATALVVSAALGVLAGGLVGRHVSERVLRWAAGLAFIALGAWTILRAS
jgi:putative Ca2+/H+ antiporter (TMEM165/GDT1 family)